MLKDAPTFSGFSVKDVDEAKKFYEEVLGLNVEQNEMGLQLKLANEHNVFVYVKSDHVPAVFTVLNFEVTGIESVIDELVSKGVTFERYDTLPAEQDERGILRGRAAQQGPDIAWFKDPSGNIFSVLES